MGILYLMSEKTIENPCSTKTIDVLDRSALVKIAKKLNIKPKELEYMASAFEHKDLKLALT